MHRCQYCTGRKCHQSLSNADSRDSRGFTLIELLMVISVILILAGITFGISRGVQNAQARAKAKADLAAISQGLERFKSVMHDYPWTTNVATSGQINANAQRLVQALRGDLKWSYASSGEVNGMEDTDRYQVIISLDVDAFQLDEATGTGNTEVIMDPWGNPYVYDYSRELPADDEEEEWDNVGYILYSEGPDGLSEPVGADGILTPEIRNHENNVDNIYLGE